MSYSYEASYQTSEETMAILLIVYVIAFLVIAIVGCVRAVVEMLFAKKCGAKLYGLVWLPIGREYVLGQIADMYEDKKSRIWNMVISIINYVVSTIAAVVMISSVVNILMGVTQTDVSEEMAASEAISLMATMFIVLGIMMIPAIAAMVYQYIVMYRTYCLKDKSNSTLWIVLTIGLTVISGLGGLIYFIFLCCNMNKPNCPKYPISQPVGADMSAVTLPTQVDTEE